VHDTERLAVDVRSGSEGSRLCASNAGATTPVQRVGEIGRAVVVDRVVTLVAHVKLFYDSASFVCPGRLVDVCSAMRFVLTWSSSDV